MRPDNLLTRSSLIIGSVRHVSHRMDGSFFTLRASSEIQLPTSCAKVEQGLRRTASRRLHPLIRICWKTNGRDARSTIFKTRSLTESTQQTDWLLTTVVSYLLSGDIIQTRSSLIHSLTPRRAALRAFAPYKFLSGRHAQRAAGRCRLLMR